MSDFVEGKIIVKSAVIAINTSLSGAVDIGGCKYLGISMPAAEPDVTERMVALEEYKAMVETEGYQAPKEIVDKNFKRGLWTSAMVDMAVTKGSITTAEKDAIVAIKVAKEV